MEARTIILAVVLAVGTNASAQLRIDSCGRVAAGGFAADPAAVLSVGNTTGHDNGYCIGTHSSTPSTSLYNIGAEGAAIADPAGGTGRSFGIRGIAGSGSTGSNYGVYGTQLGPQYGAGVSGSDGTAPEVAADGMYAGLFFGDVLATSTTAARLVNGHDAPSTQADTISGSLSSLLAPIRTYTKSYPTGTFGAVGGSQDGSGLYPGSAERASNSASTYENHYSVVMGTGISPGLVTEDAQGRALVNYTELVPLMAEMAWKTALLFLGRNTARVLGEEMTPQEAAELAGWTPDDAAALMAVAVAREEISGMRSTPATDAASVTLMFFDESGALLSQRTQTVSERSSGSIGQCPQGAAYCAIVADGAEVQTVRVAR